MNTKEVAVIGTGAFATAITSVLALGTQSVKMYGIVQSQIDDININHNNSGFYEVSLPNHVTASTNLKLTLTNVNYVFIAVPAAFTEDVVELIAKTVKHDICLIFLVKGVNSQATTIKELFFCNILNKVCTKSHVRNISYLYGPNIAKETADQKPVFCTLSCDNDEMRQDLKTLFRPSQFHLQIINDDIGINVCAVFKNIIALLSGISHGYYKSDSTTASAVTLAWNQIIQFGKDCGAQLDTFNSFAGFGDLFLTAHSPKSRNFTLGYKIGESQDVDASIKSFHLLSEGYNSCRVVYDVFKEQNEFPIDFIKALYQLLFEKGSILFFFSNFFNKNLY